MKDKEKKGEAEKEGVGGEGKERLSRRDAMKRMAKGAALIGTLGITSIVTQGQDECSGGYLNLVPPGYYNYSNAYDNYSDGYNDYSDSYNNYNNTYSNLYSDLYKNYADYNNYSDYSNYYDHGYSNSTYYNW
jgi:hypothetical protein